MKGLGVLVCIFDNGCFGTLGVLIQGGLSMAVSVFVYGTLLAPEVMRAVTQCEFKSVRATARGYARYFLKRRVYPGIVAKQGEAVEGVVYLDVGAGALARLDYFEGTEYVRESIRVATETSELIAESYVVPAACRDLLSQDPWNPDDFFRQGLKSFLEHAQQCMIDYQPGGYVRR